MKALLLFLILCSVAPAAERYTYSSHSRRHVYIQMNRQAGLRWVRQVEREMSRSSHENVILAVPVERYRYGR